MCVHLEIFVEIFVDFDGLQSNFHGVRQFNLLVYFTVAIYK